MFGSSSRRRNSSNHSVLLQFAAPCLWCLVVSVAGVLVLFGASLWNDSVNQVTSVTAETIPLHGSRQLPALVLLSDAQMTGTLPVESHSNNATTPHPTANTRLTFESAEADESNGDEDISKAAISDTPLLTPRIIYYPRITKTGSTTVYMLFQEWLPLYINWKLRKFATDFLDKPNETFSRIEIDSNKNATENMLLAIKEHSKKRVGRGWWFVLSNSVRRFNTNIGTREQRFAEMGDGCAHTGGNEMLKQRAAELTTDFANSWKRKLNWLQTAERILVDGLFESSLIAASSGQLTTNATMEQKRVVIRSVLGSANASLEIPFLFYVHFPFLKSVEEWMRRYVAPFPFQQLISFREPTARITSMFYFLRNPNYIRKRANQLQNDTHFKDLLQCTNDLDNALSNALPNARSDPYDTCHMPVNLQLKWMCGDLEHCPCSDVMNETHVELAINTTLEHFDFVGFIGSMAADIVEIRHVFFDDVPESEWETVLPTPRGRKNRHFKKKNANDSNAVDILTRINQAEVSFFERLFAVAKGNGS